MKLNKCPFCGNEVTVWTSNNEYFVECDNEHCGMTYGKNCGYNFEEMLNVWNDVTNNMACSVKLKRPKVKRTNYSANIKNKSVSNEKIELESILNEIKEILTFYSFDVPMVYGDGEETVEKTVLLEEVEYAIQSIRDIEGDKE